MTRTSCVAKSFSTLLAFAVMCGTAIDLHGQVAGASISGSVTDSSGKVVTNAIVSIKNVDTGINREVTTNDEGFYSAPNLLPGTYEVKFSAPGFKNEVKRNITLTVGGSVSLDQALRVGSITESVTVQSEVPAVQTASSDISAVV